MKTLVLSLLAMIIITDIPVCGQELLENTDFSKTVSSGRILSWNLLHGTRGSVENGTLTIHNTADKAVVTQQLRPRPGKRVVFAVELKNESAGRVRAYVEFMYRKNGEDVYHNAGTQWRDAEAGKWITLKDEITLPADYRICYLAVMNEKGGNLSIRKPSVTTGADLLIRNTDFTNKAKNGNAVFWSYRGKMPGSLVYSGDTAKFADGLLIQSELSLKPESRYTVSYFVRGKKGGQFRSYIEWNKRDEQGKVVYGGGSGTSRFKAVPAEWTKQEYPFTLSRNSLKPYIVFGVKDVHTVEFKGIEIKEMEVPRDLGGVWNLRKHRKMEDGILIEGKQPAASLQGIPVTAGKKYAISYDAVVVDMRAAEAAPFFPLKTKVSPVGVIGATGFADILLNNSEQKRSHIFTVPAESEIKNITFSISSAMDGSVKLNHFQISEVEIKDSDFWKVALTKPFYRDSFFHGDDVSVIEGEAEAKGADRVRLTLQGKTTEFPVKDAKASFRLPFNLPEGKYELKCEFLKNDRVEKTESKIVARYPAAPNTVTVLPNRRLAFNGKPFFPVYQNIRGFSRDFLYFAAQSGVNTIFSHMTEENKLLERLNLAHQYEMKVIIYPGPPRTSAGLARFRKSVKECLTNRVKAHPALFAYLLPDEPLLGGVPVDVISAEYQFMKEHDPYHPVWINSAPRNEIADLKPYADASDIFGVDIYPIPYPNSHSGIADKKPTACGKYAQRMNEAASFKRPIWIYLQGFAWHEAPEYAGKDNVPVRPHPSLRESRFMAYDALLNGATGYFPWGTRRVRSTAFMETLGKMYMEMHQVSGLFAWGRQLPDVKTSHAGVRCAVMELEGKQYYFLLNLTEQPQEAATSVKGKVLLSDGGTLINGKVTLAPFEALVCSEHALPEPFYRLPERDEHLEKSGDPVLRMIKENHTFLNAPRYTGKANWIWYQGGQHGLTRCFAYKSFEVTATGENVILKVAADDAYIVYLNGKKIGEGEGWSQMHSYDLKNLVRSGKNDLIILGIDRGAAPCGILAELSVENQIYPTDISWKVVPAYKDDKPPENFMNAHNAVIVAPYGQGAWRRSVRMVKE